MIQTAYASDFSRARTHLSIVPASTKDVLRAEYRAVLDSGETATLAEWESDEVESVGLVSANIDDTGASVTFSASREGDAVIRCQLTTSAGRVLSQYFRVVVNGGVFSDATPAGAARVTVSVPG